MAGVAVQGVVPMLRKADFWLRLPSKPPGGKVSVSPYALAASLGLRPDQLASVRVFKMAIVSYFCEQFPVFVQFDGDLGASLNTVTRNDTDDRKCWAVLFGVSHKEHAHAVELDRFARMRTFDFSNGITFKVSSTRGVLMPHDAGFQLRVGVVPVARRPPSPPEERHPAAVTLKPLRSPVMQRVRSTPERLHSDFDESPSFPRVRATARDSDWSENDLPTAYETTTTEESDATAIVNHSSEASSSSEEPSRESPSKQVVPDTPPPHHRRSGSGALRFSRGTAPANRARDQPLPTSSASNLYTFM